jgi:glyoxylase-like metal-dependent hydrolase (beta-lactamase superfamily II)
LLDPGAVRDNGAMSTTLPPWAEDLGHGLYAIDTGFHRARFDAAYLLVGDGRAAFVDTGTNFAVPRLLGTLDALGIPARAVEAVIPTHVHLDHAGGVGTLMQALPEARLWVHPRGARHMVDPSKLYAGALAVYGAEAMARDYGELVPVHAERVLSPADGETARIAGRSLSFIDTPGHALHHHCIWDETTQGWFTGDTFGLSYREFDTPAGAWVLPTSTPVQFDPDAMVRSVQRLMAAEPQWLYLTHFGRVGDVPALGRQFMDLLARTVSLARAVPAGDGRHAALADSLARLYRDSLAAHGCRLPADDIDRLLALDVELNAQGIGIWLDREAAAARPTAA